MIERLFRPGNSRSYAAFPLRMVLFTEQGDTDQLLISVPKRCFKHAVDRNRVKRQVREAYRTNKDALRLPDGQRAVMALLWLDNHHYPSHKVAAKVRNLVIRASEGAVEK